MNSSISIKFPYCTLNWQFFYFHNPPNNQIATSPPSHIDVISCSVTHTTKKLISYARHSHKYISCVWFRIDITFESFITTLPFQYKSVVSTSHKWSEWHPANGTVQHIKIIEMKESLWNFLLKHVNAIVCRI